MGFAKARPIPRKTEEGFLPEVEMTMAGQENYPLFFVYAGENGIRMAAKSWMPVTLAVASLPGMTLGVAIEVLLGY